MVVEAAQWCDWSDLDKTSYFWEHSCTSQERFGGTAQELLFWSGDDLRARHHNMDVSLGTILRHQDSPAKYRSLFLPLWMMGCLLGWDALGEPWNFEEMFTIVRGDSQFFPAGPFLIQWMFCWDVNTGNAPWCQILSVHTRFSLCYVYRQCFQVSIGWRAGKCVSHNSSLCPRVFAGT